MDSHNFDLSRNKLLYIIVGPAKQPSSLDAPHNLINSFEMPRSVEQTFPLLWPCLC